MSGTQAPQPEPESFSVASAMEAVDAMFTALSKPKQREYLGNLNEITVVLAVAARRLGIDRDSLEWRRELSKLPQPETR